MAITEVTVLNALPSDEGVEKHPWRQYGRAPRSHTVRYVTGDGTETSDRGYELLSGESRNSALACYPCFLDALGALRRNLTARSIPEGSVVIRARDGAILAEGRRYG